MSTAAASLLPLQGVLQAYDWGKKGSSSAAAVLHASNTSGSVDEGKPGAELWMGSHPSGPARVVLGNGQTAALSEVIGGEQLVYLLKVLSISSALSIQSHPDKALAEALHKRDPTNYKDSNHKPEMAVAVTAFEAMCGFRPVQEISAFLREFPEFRALVGEGVAADFERTAAAHALDPSTDYRPALRRVFTQAMTPSKEAVTANLTALISRIQADVAKEGKAAAGAACEAKEATSSPVNLDVRELILRLHGQHPNDVGIFAVFLLNCFGCLPGDALVLPANEPHAYLSGDIVECMACSDNVVRAGLTPKFRDTETLCEMLTYNAGKPPVYRGEPLDSVTTLYLPSPPITEFCLARVSLPAATASSRPDYTLKGVPGYSIILAYTGSGRISAGKDTLDFKRGSIFLLPSGLDVKISSSPAEDALLFRCCANIKA